MKLKLLGLTEYEEKAYLALVRIGKGTASQVSRHGRVSYGKIYEVLASLENKGLVKVIPDKTKLFVPSDPEQLMTLVEDKEKQLDDLKKSVSEMKQVYEGHGQEVVEMVQGKRNFYRLIRKMEKAEKFNYAIKYTSEYNPEWVRRDKELRKKGVDVKVMTRYDTETRKDVTKWKKLHNTIKKIENEGVAVGISENEVILALIKNNIIMSIKDRAFIHLMKDLYLAKYQQSEKV